MCTNMNAATPPAPQPSAAARQVNISAIREPLDRVTYVLADFRNLQAALELIGEGHSRDPHRDNVRRTVEILGDVAFRLEEELRTALQLIEAATGLKLVADYQR